MSQQDPSGPSPQGPANPYGQPISQPPPVGQYPPQPPPGGQYPPQLPPGGQYPRQPPAGQYPPQLPPGTPGYPPYGPPPPSAPRPLSPSDERMWGMLSFLLAIIAGFLAPLIIYLVYKDRSGFVRETSREALNLSITAALVGVCASIGLFAFGFAVIALVPLIGIVMFIAWFVIVVGYSIAVLVFEIIGAMRANNGQVYRVPLILRLVK